MASFVTRDPATFTPITPNGESNLATLPEIFRCIAMLSSVVQVHVIGVTMRREPALTMRVGLVPHTP